MPIRDAPPLEDASILHTPHATFFEVDTVVPKVLPEADPPFRLFVNDDEFKVGEGGICYDRMDWEDTIPVLALELSVPDDNVAARGFISREDQPLPRYEAATARSRNTRSLSFMFDPVLAAPAPPPLAFLRIVPGGRLDDWYVWQHAHADTIVQRIKKISGHPRPLERKIRPLDFGLQYIGQDRRKSSLGCNCP
ncbi:hypothetical protein EI94DRAFT_1804785 [Lactarius quietus]|nr:hypothetical protein EI94DRAFT_1804785 [Lactarius quietus]